MDNLLSIFLELQKEMSLKFTNNQIHAILNILINMDRDDLEALTDFNHLEERILQDIEVVHKKERALAFKEVKMHEKHKKIEEETEEYMKEIQRYKRLLDLAGLTRYYKGNKEE